MPPVSYLDSQSIIIGKVECDSCRCWLRCASDIPGKPTGRGERETQCKVFKSLDPVKINVLIC